MKISFPNLNEIDFKSKESMYILEINVLIFLQHNQNVDITDDVNPIVNYFEAPAIANQEIPETEILEPDANDNASGLDMPEMEIPGQERTETEIPQNDNTFIIDGAGDQSRSIRSQTRDRNNLIQTHDMNTIINTSEYSFLKLSIPKNSTYSDKKFQD